MSGSCGGAFDEDVHQSARGAREGGEVWRDEGAVDRVEGYGGQAHELAGFLDGEGGLHGPAAADDVDALDAALGEGLDGVLGDVGLAEHVDVLEQHAGDVEGDVALANDDGLVAAGEVRGEGGVLREAVVPAYKLAGRVDAIEVLAGDAEGAVLGGAVGEDDGVVVAQDAGQGDGDAVRVIALGADGDVTDEGEVGRVGDLLKLFLAVLRL